MLQRNNKDRNTEIVIVTTTMVIVAIIAVVVTIIKIHLIPVSKLTNTIYIILSNIIYIYIYLCCIGFARTFLPR